MINMKWHKVSAGHWRSGDYEAGRSPGWWSGWWQLLTKEELVDYFPTLRQAKQAALSHANELATPQAIRNALKKALQEHKLKSSQ